MSYVSARPCDTQTDAQTDAWFVHYRRCHDRATRDRLVGAHLHVADRCARRYAQRGETLADLTQVARLALVRAVERFDPDRGVRFESFAIPTILGELRHHFRDNCWMVSVPRGAKELRPQVLRASEQMSQHLGRHPTHDEIAESLDLAPEHVATTLESNRHYRAASWEAMRESGVDPSVRTSSGDDLDDAERSATRVDVQRTVATLDERLQQIVIWRFYEQCTQTEIGERLGIGQVQVSRLLARALAQLRSLLDQSSDTVGSPTAAAV